MYECDIVMHNEKYIFALRLCFWHKAPNIFRISSVLCNKAPINPQKAEFGELQVSGRFYEKIGPL